MWFALYCCWKHSSAACPDPRLLVWALIPHLNLIPFHTNWDPCHCWGPLLNGIINGIMYPPDVTSPPTWTPSHCSFWFGGQSTPSPPPQHLFCLKSQQMQGCWTRHRSRTLHEAPYRLDPPICQGKGRWPEKPRLFLIFPPSLLFALSSSQPSLF